MEQKRIVELHIIILGIPTDKLLQQFWVYLFWFVFLVTHIT